MIGQTLGHYKIVEKLGEGGMGEVYRAEDTTLKRQIALKVLPASMAGNPERLARFEREAKTLASLNHPNIVTIHTVEAIDNVHFLTMELLQGRTLTDHIPKTGLRFREFFKIGIALADALAVAHEQSVIHRDLKPSNVMVTQSGSAKVLDFGLAKRSPPEDLQLDSEAPTEPLTGEGRILGTIPFMSPEQIKGGPVDHRADIFSLGIILYQMATGDRPFKGQSSAEIQSAILGEIPRPVDQVKAVIPHHVARIISLCLEKEPDARFQSAKDVRNELSALLKELSSDESEARPKVSRATPSIARLGRYLAGIVLLILVAVAARYAIRNWFDDEPWAVSAEAQELLDQAELLELRAITIESLEAAEDRYRRALGLEPDNPVIQARLARLLVTLQVESPDPGRPDQILQLAESAIAADPRIAKAWVALAHHSLRWGDYSEGLKSAETAIKLSPKDHAGYTVRGRLLVALGRVDEGLATLRQAIELSGTDLEARLALARSLWDLGHNNEAAGEYERILQYTFDMPEALNNLGIIYGQQGRLLDAIPLFRRLLEISGKADAAYNLGNCYFYSDRLDEAIVAYLQVLEIDPEHTYAAHGVADAYRALGAQEKAETYYEQAVENYDRYLKAAGRSAETLGYRAVCLAKIGRYPEAIENVQEAQALAPDYGQVLFSTAQVYALAGDRKQALAFIQKAIDKGYPRQEFERDPAFIVYRDDSEFRALLEAAALP